MKDYPNEYKAIFRFCEEERLFKILLNLIGKTVPKSELRGLGLENKEINLLVSLGVLRIVGERLTFNKPFEEFWSSGAWLPAYLISLLVDENKIDFDFCVHVQHNYR